MNLFVPRLIKEWKGNRPGWICRGTGFFTWDERPEMAWHKWAMTMIRMPDEIKRDWIAVCKLRWLRNGFDV